jgi:hypothetical protein
VANALGGSWIMSKDLLARDAWSSDHFSQEVKTGMTELAAILTQCRDTIFTVSFKKKVDLSEIEANLKKINFNDAKSIKSLQKRVTEGENREITGYLTNVENDLGRSLVIDLNVQGKSQFRLVDHRTINWIIFKNVKYSLGKKSTQEDLPLKADSDNKWDTSKLQLKNWFSSTAYYRVNSITDENNAVVSEKK